MKENRFYLVESLLDNPFTIERISDDWDSGWGGINKEFKIAKVIVDKIKPISIVFYKNFIIDIWPNRGYGTRQLGYLNKHKKEISKKLMEISGLNKQQIQMQIEQNKAIERMVCHDFFRSIDVNINRNSDNSRYSVYFQEYIEKIHLPVSAWSDDFYKDDLEHAWKNFYKGDWSEELTLFGAGTYFRRKAENEKNGLDQSEFVQFMNENKGGTYAHHAKFFSLKDLDEGFEEFKKLKGKDSKFEESIVKIESRLAETFEKTIKDLQKEGFLKEAKSFDLSFTGKGINIKLNEMKEPTCFPCKLLIFDTIAKKNLHYKLNPKYNSNNPNSIYAIWDYDNTSNNDVILNNKDDFYKALHELYRYATDKVDPDYRTMKNWEWDFSGQLLCYGRGSYGQFEMKLINPESEPEFEDEEPSKEPFIDELYHMEEEYDIFNKEFYGKWPGSYAFYDEVLDNCQDTNVDYDDIKDSYEFTDYDIDFCLDYIRGEDGENVAKKIFGTVENVEKSLIEYLNDRNNENNAFKQFLDYFRDGLEHHEEEDWNEQVHSAAGDWDAWNYREDEDED